MSQVSRPVQIALLAVLLIGALWFVALRPHSQTDTTATQPAPVAPVAVAPHKPLNAKTPVVGGLFGAVNKANGAVAASSANANQLEHNSAAAGTSPTAAAPSAPATTATAAAPVTTATATAAAPATSGAAAATHAATAPATKAGTATTPAAVVSPAVVVGQELAAGKTVALLIWNPLGTDDRAVHAALQALVKPNGPLVVHYATAGQVADYGSIVSASQVLETPTLLVMKGKSVQSITDLQDPSDLRQFIGDLQQGGPGEVLSPKLAVYATGTTRTTYIAKTNAVCAKLDKKAVAGFASPLPSMSGLNAAVAFDRSYFNTVAAVPTPLADRLYLHTTWLAASRALNEYAAEATAAAAGNNSRAHSLALSAEQNADSAFLRLNTYGLTTCAGAVSPTATP